MDERNLWFIEMPLISVIIPTYNRAGYIEETLQSVLNQTFNDYEIIVINDGSMDNTLEVLKKYKSNPKVKIYSQENEGCPAALNSGIGVAKGKYICWLSSDDLWYSDKLEKQIEIFLNNEHLGMVYSDYDIINEKGGIVQKHYKTADIDVPLAERMRFINGCSTMIKKECFEILGGFDESLVLGHDGDMWFRIGSQYPMFRIPASLIKYREGNERLSSKFFDSMIKYPALLMVKHNLPLEIRFPSFIGRDGLKAYLSEAKNKLTEMKYNYHIYRIKTLLFKKGWYYYLKYIKCLVQYRYKNLKAILSILLGVSGAKRNRRYLILKKLGFK